jgi:transcriptional regulator with XRE-family HTH domain
MIQEEIKRLLQVLRTTMRLLDVSNRDVEKKLGLSYGYLSRLFAGTIELKVEHILSVLEVIGLTPAEFFHLAYPRPAGQASDAAIRMRSIMQGFQPIPDDRPASPSSEDVERMMMSALKKLLGDAGQK